MNNTRIAANCCDITISKSRYRNTSGSIEYSESSEAEYKRQHRIQRKRRSGIQAAAGYTACCLSGARAPAYCLLAADIICRNLKDLLQSVTNSAVMRLHLCQSVTNSAVTRWLLCQSVTNVTNVTHFRVRVFTFCGKDKPKSGKDRLLKSLKTCAWNSLEQQLSCRLRLLERAKREWNIKRPSQWRAFLL